MDLEAGRKLDQSRSDNRGGDSRNEGVRRDDDGNGPPSAISSILGIFQIIRSIPCNLFACINNENTPC